MGLREAPPQLSRAEAEAFFRKLPRRAARHRRLRWWTRITTTIATSLVAAAVLVWAMTSLVGLRANHFKVMGTQEQLPNYRFENVQVIYPYVEPDTGSVDPSKAGVEGTISWTSDEYPGVHDCAYTAYGPDGSIVGQDTGQVDAMSEGARHPSPIAVSGPAISGSVECNPTRLDTPVAYEVSDGHVQTVLDPATGMIIGARADFKVAWPEGVEPPSYPGANSCAARILRPSGELVTVYQFTLSGAEPGTLETPLIDTSDLRGVPTTGFDSLTATVTCEPFTGPPDHTGPTVHA